MNARERDLYAMADLLRKRVNDLEGEIEQWRRECQFQADTAAEERAKRDTAHLNIDDIRALLDMHLWLKGSVCNCGWVPTVHPYTVEHRQHVAEKLAEARRAA